MLSSGSWWSSQLCSICLCSCDTSDPTGSPQRACQVQMTQCTNWTIEPSLHWHFPFVCELICGMESLWLTVNITLQCCAVIILPDGAVKPAREARLPAQYPGLHHHGDSCPARGRDQQPWAHGQKAGWPRYRTKEIMCQVFSSIKIYLVPSFQLKNISSTTHENMPETVFFHITFV